MVVTMKANRCINVSKLWICFGTGEHNWKCCCTVFSASSCCSLAMLTCCLAHWSGLQILTVCAFFYYPVLFLAMSPLFLWPSRELEDVESWQMQTQRGGQATELAAAQKRKVSKTKPQVCANKRAAWSQWLKGGNESCQQPVILHRERSRHSWPRGVCWSLRSSSHPPQHAHNQVSVTEGSHKQEWKCRQLHFWSWQRESPKHRSQRRKASQKKHRREKRPGEEQKRRMIS